MKDVPTVIIATRNPGKLKEFETFFAQWAWKVKGLSDFPDVPDIVENGRTFEENARIKAEALYAWLKRPVLADDSGLEVDALDGQPGVYSARYAGEGAADEENNAKLLAALQGVPADRRQARFRCVLVMKFDEERQLTAEGVCEGVILEAPRGRGGFGYDPLFYVPALGKTLAEISAEEKNRISHRGAALRQLADQLAKCQLIP
ncbi:MAG: non-canonical purine NTP pyrophosphatase [Bacillaceae bacterium G1]|nr:MAG: non-canonical purine NTP pyrophosphatase [Bacillaceae bacterium G1]